MSIKTFSAAVLLLLSIAPLNSASAQDKPADKPLPQIELLSDQTVPLGVLTSYEMKTVSYRFRNKGKGAANLLNIVSTCPCVSATSDKMTVPPGEEFVVSLTLDAGKVHDEFRRGVWVETNDPENPRLMLSVTGSVRPLFEGLPPMPIRLAAAEEGAAWTNTYTLRPTETNIVLGAPVIATNGPVSLALSVQSTNAEGKTAFVIRAVLVSQGAGKAAATASIPVEGRPDLNLRPLALAFQTASGAALRVAPSKVLIFASDRMLARTLRISTNEKEARPEELTWEPRLEGLSVSAENGLIKSSLMVTLSLTPACAEALLKAKETKVTFSYPGHKPVSIEFGESSSKRNPPQIPTFPGRVPLPQRR
jgi:hypothetical protein